MLLVAEAGVLGLSVKQSTITHENSGRGLFAEKNFGEGEILGYSYGTLQRLMVRVRCKLQSNNS